MCQRPVLLIPRGQPTLAHMVDGLEKVLIALLVPWSHVWHEDMALLLSHQAVSIFPQSTPACMFKMKAGLYSICKHLFLRDAVSKE